MSKIGERKDAWRRKELKDKRPDETNRGHAMVWFVLTSDISLHERWPAPAWQSHTLVTRCSLLCRNSGFEWDNRMCSHENISNDSFTYTLMCNPQIIVQHSKYIQKSYGVSKKPCWSPGSLICNLPTGEYKINRRINAVDVVDWWMYFLTVYSY